MAGFNLRSYLDRFPEVCKIKFNRTYDFSRLEKELEQLRQGKRWLAARDVTKIFDPANTPFSNYWPQPNEKELNQALTRERLVLAPLPADDRKLLERLLSVFHNLGHVSIVLRLVHPDRFGIFSTPIVHLLQIQRPNTVDLYMAFRDELQAWQEHFGMASVAETEMALWAYHQLDAMAARAGAGAVPYKELAADVWVQRRRIAQVLRPFLRNYGPLELARILTYEHSKLAGKIAGEEYERLLRLAALRLAGGLNLKAKGWIEILFRQLVECRLIAPEDKPLLDKAWQTRCAAVHPDETPTPEEVETMIDTIERVCRPWSKR